MSLLFIGTVALDSMESPFGKVDRVPGGSALYGSLAASYFSKEVKLVAVVGGDFPKKEVKMMQDHHIDTEGLQIKDSEKSFYWAGKYHENMNSRDTLVTDLNVLADFDPIIPESYQDCEYLMLGNLTPQIQKKVIERLVRRPKLIVMDTMNYWMNNELESLIETIQLVDVLTINEEEARQLSGEYSLAKAAKKILAMGPKYLVIKKGEHGALLFSPDEVFFAPGLPLEEVIDPTGAGDSFAGGFIGLIAEKGDTSFGTLKKAIIHGSAMGSFCVEKFGPDALQFLTQKDIDLRVKEFVSLTTL
jgi:sugar/nucleoside kinase (ribokinase family)